MYEINLVAEKDFNKWLWDIRYFENFPCTEYDGVEYIRCNEACNLFQLPVHTLTVQKQDTISEVIKKVTGQTPRLYSIDEVESSLKKSSYKSKRTDYFIKEVLAEASKMIQVVQNFSLVKLEQTEESYEKKELSNEKTITQSEIHEGDVLLIRKTSLSEIIRECCAYVPERPDHTHCNMLMVRNCCDFIRMVKAVNSNEDEEKWKLNLHSYRPSIALLYTDEDPHIASYVRAHFDALDKASGFFCDVFVIEDPSKVDPNKYWMHILERKAYIVWKLLGWTDSVPYSKSEAYRIAEKLNVAFDMLPCAVVIDTELNIKQIFPLGNDLTETFRKIFAHFQLESKGLSNLFEFDPDLADAANNNIKNTVCFLSYNHNDKKLVKDVASTLHSYGIETWFDEWEILPGDKITVKIEEGLAKATSIVIFLSQNSVASKWVKEELHTSIYQSISKNTPNIIPVQLSKCEIPILLSNYKLIESNNPTMIADEIRRAVHRITGKPSVQSSAA